MHLLSPVVERMSTLKVPLALPRSLVNELRLTADADGPEGERKRGSGEDHVTAVRRPVGHRPIGGDAGAGSDGEYGTI